MSEATTRNSLSNSSKNRNTWLGESKRDKDGEYWTSVLVERSNKRFTLQEFDTVQLEAPDDERPFVGTILRMYEMNFRKTADIEWFFLKNEIVDFAPKNHKNQHIEEKEVFLAEGEVEIVDNLLGSIKNPCYIVYLTPQDSLLEGNQNAMANARFSELYFCRYSFNESKRMTFPISPMWAQNKYILKMWDTIPEPIRKYLLKMPLQCFKSVGGVGAGSKSETKAEAKAVSADKPDKKNAPAVTTTAKAVASVPAAAPAKTLSDKMPNLTALSSISKSNDTKGAAQSSAKAGSSASGATSKSSTTVKVEVPVVPAVTVADVNTRSSASVASVQGSVTSISSPKKESRRPPAQAASKPTTAPVPAPVPVAAPVTVAAVTEEPKAQEVHAITPEEVRSLDVLDLALQLLDADIPSSSESDSDSSADDRRQSVQSNRRTSGVSAAARGAPEIKKEISAATEKLQRHWSELTDRKRKQYITQAKALKEQHSGTTAAVSATTSAIANATTSTSISQPVVSVPTTSGATLKKGASTATTASTATVASTASVASVASEATEPQIASVYSDSELSEDDFDDIVMAEYVALEGDLRKPEIREETVAYKLFCYEVQQNESSSGEETESSDDDRRGSRGRMSNPYKIKRPPLSAEELVKKALDRATQKEDRLYKRWTDLSYKKLRLYVKRAQRLLTFHTHQTKTGKAPSTASEPAVAEVVAEKPVAEQDAPYATILAAMDAGCEEFDLAFQWMCIDISLGVKNAGDSAGRADSAAQSAAAAKNNGVIEGHFLRKEWANLTERKRGYYYERVRLLRDTYRPHTQASSAKADTGRGRRSAAPAAQVKAAIKDAVESDESDSDADSDLDEVLPEDEDQADDGEAGSLAGSAVTSDGDELTSGVSESLLHAVKAGMGKYEIALQLLAADLSESGSSSDDAPAPRGKNGSSRSSRGGKDSKEQRRSQPRSFQMEMDRIVQKFSNIPERRKSEYMKLAAALQSKYGHAEPAASFSPGSGARARAKANMDARARTTVSITSSENRRGKPVVRAAPGARASSRRSNAEESEEEREDGERSAAPRRKRRFADAMLIDSFEVAPSTRRNSSERRSRYDEVQLKRTLAASRAMAQGQGKSRRRSGSQVQEGSQSDDSGDSVDSAAENGSQAPGSEDEEVAAQRAKPAPRQQRNRPDRRRSAGADDDVAVELPSRSRRSISRPIIVASPAKPAQSGGRQGRGAAQVPAVQKPVHALIPTFATLNNEEDAQSESVQSADEMDNLLAPQKRGRGRPRRSDAAQEMEVAEEVPARRSRGRARANNYNAPADAGVSDIEEFSNEKFSGEQAPKRGRGRPRREDPAPLPAEPAEDEGSGSDLESVSSSAAMESMQDVRVPVKRSRAPKRRRGRPLRNYERASHKKQRRDADSGSDLPSVSSDAEKNINSYAMQTKRRANSKDNVFMAPISSPSLKGSIDKHAQREGDNFQAAVPTWEESQAHRDTTREQAGVAPTWVATVETGRTPRNDPRDSAVPVLTDEMVVQYLAQAHAIIAEMKATMLKEYFESSQGATQMQAQAQASVDAEGEPSAAAVKAPVESTDGSFVLVSSEIDEAMLLLLADCENNATAALEKVSTELGSHLVLWTSAEQQAIGLAYEKYGMSRRALRNSVPDKKFEHMWDYTQRFLGSAEELEENTTYTNADGADQILPARESHTFHAASAGRASVGGGVAAAGGDKRNSSGGAGSSASNAASAEDFIAEEGNKFFERLSRSVDETSFWQLLFMLSSVLKSGEFTSAQLVVKAHYILSMATYNANASFKQREQQYLATHASAAATTATSPADANGDATASTATTSETDSAANQADASAESVPEAATVNTATTLATAVKAEADAVLFATKEDAIREFNMFLPVMVCQI